MSELLDFKVYLTKEKTPEEGKPEIRRCNIDSAVASNYTYVREKLQVVFPDLKGRRFTIYWKDGEDDNIIISTNEEMQIALTETKNLNRLHKLYVTLHSNYEEDRSSYNFSSNYHSKPNQKQWHNGIICDGCDKDVYGFRYKCLQCVDYDLCSDCETKELHPEHCMIRLSKPMQWRSHYGKRLSHHINKFMRKASTCSPEEEPKECPYKNKKCSNVWFDAVTTYLNDWANVAGECQFNENDNLKRTNSEQNHSQSSTSSEKSPTDTNIEFLKNIGENIAQFLDPLGIDVNLLVKTDKSAETTEKENQTEKPDDSTIHNKNDNSESYNKNDNSTLNEKKNDKSTVNKTNEVSGKQYPNVTESKQDEASSTLLQNSETKHNNQSNNETGNSKADDWTLIDDENTSSSPVEVDSASGPLDKEKPKKRIENGSKVSEDGKLYPLLPNVGDNIWHTDPKIQRALEAMMQMGFSNEGGWLTHLLVAKNGDISKVLDVLQPVRQ